MSVAASPPPRVAPARIVAWGGERYRARDDTLAVEEPLEIRLAGCSVAVTMRTPGDDFDLALGFLFTEGILRGMADVASIGHCPEAGAEGNIVNVNPSDPALVDPDRWRRNFFATSSCGVCGKASIGQVRQRAAPVESGVRLPAVTLCELARQFGGAQPAFRLTGGLHAAALYRPDGTAVVAREDIGRHNAVDKVIGAALRAGDPVRDCVLMVSSRASFEVVQKALMAGIPIVAAVSAPSSLAVELARAGNMTLVGFLRPGDGGGRFNIYSGGGRIGE